MTTIFISRLSFVRCNSLGQGSGRKRDRSHQDEDRYEEQDETENRYPRRPFARARVLDRVQLTGLALDRAERSPRVECSPAGPAGMAA
jgi:hypothetical protein